LAIKCGPVSIM